MQMCIKFDTTSSVSFDVFRNVLFLSLQILEQN